LLVGVRRPRFASGSASIALGHKHTSFICLPAHRHLVCSLTQKQRQFLRLRLAMSPQILPVIAWAGLVLLAILCLPVARKFVLELSAWALRLAMLALLAGGAYLWFRPGEMPAGVSNFLDAEPWLVSILPDRSAAHFSICAASIIVTLLLPILAMLDVTRRLSGRRLERPRVVTAETVAEAPMAEPEPVVEPAPMGVPVMRPVQRRTAANAIASTWSHGPSRIAGR